MPGAKKHISKVKIRPDGFSKPGQSEKHHSIAQTLACLSSVDLACVVLITSNKIVIWFSFSLK